MPYGIKIWTADGDLILDGVKRVLRLHTSGSMYFSIPEYSSKTITQSFTALDMVPCAVGYFDPSLSGYSMTLTTSSITITATGGIFGYSGYFYYWIFRKR